MPHFTKDVRVDTLAIGLVQAVSWFFVYPSFIGDVSRAARMSEYVATPFLALFGLPLAAAFCFFLLLSLLPLLFVTLMVFCASLAVRHIFAYRLQNAASWATKLNLTVAFTFISAFFFIFGMLLFPPELSSQRLESSAQTFLVSEHEIHDWLWPAGVFVVTIILAFFSSLITCRMLRPTFAKNDQEKP